MPRKQIGLRSKKDDQCEKKGRGKAITRVDSKTPSIYYHCKAKKEKNKNNKNKKDESCVKSFLYTHSHAAMEKTQRNRSLPLSRTGEIRQFNIWVGFLYAFLFPLPSLEKRWI